MNTRICIIFVTAIKRDHGSDQAHMKNTEIMEIATTKQAADMLGVAVSTVQKWVELGELASWKTPGGH
jgi:excisionase family DNA binding protein